jgi:hypothetical protein
MNRSIFSAIVLNKEYKDGKITAKVIPMANKDTTTLTGNPRK